MAELADFTAGQGQKLRGLQWAGNDHILLSVHDLEPILVGGRSRTNNFGVIATDLKTGSLGRARVSGRRGQQCWTRQCGFRPGRVPEIGGEILAVHEWLFYAGDTFGARVD